MERSARESVTVVSWRGDWVSDTAGGSWASSAVRGPRQPTRRGGPLTSTCRRPVRAPHPERVTCTPPGGRSVPDRVREFGLRGPRRDRGETVCQWFQQNSHPCGRCTCMPRLLFTRICCAPTSRSERGLAFVVRCSRGCRGSVATRLTSGCGAAAAARVIHAPELDGVAHSMA